MKPAPGRIVFYRLSAQDVASITPKHQIEGGNPVAEGDTFPLIITRVWGDDENAAFNGTLFLDGPETRWITSTAIGEGPRYCSWPRREDGKAIA